MPNPHAGVGEPDASQDDLDVALAQRQPRRQRWLRGALIAVVLALVMAGVVRGLLALPGAAGNPPTGAAETHMTLVASNVAFGTVTLNGAPQRGDALPLQIRLAASRDTITLDAPPFVPVRCVVLGAPGALAVDPGSAGRCAITFDSVGTAQVHTIINILLTGADLPPDALASAERVVAADLARINLGATTVPAGQYYATDATGAGTISSQRATAPLRATVGVILAPTTDDVFPTNALASGVVAGGDARTTLDRCADLGCALPLDVGYTVPAHGWIIGAAVALDWRFTTAAGALAGEARYGLGAIPVAFSVGMDGTPGAATWTLATDLQATDGPFNSPPDQCLLGQDVIAQLLIPTLSAQNVNVSEQLRSQSAFGPEGCEEVAGVPGGTEPAIYVWRFGVVLAADDAAHTQLPSVPLAPANEKRAVGVL
jgi:hypothetical protein